MDKGREGIGEEGGTRRGIGNRYAATPIVSAKSCAEPTSKISAVQISTYIVSKRELRLMLNNE